jgi:ATP-dependent protease HslVU (ClpYQ) ATPase subunit
MAQLLLEAKNSPINQFQNLWGMKDVELVITPEAMEVIASQVQSLVNQDSLVKWPIKCFMSLEVLTG